MGQIEQKITLETINKKPGNTKRSLGSFFASALIGIIFAGLFSTSMYVFATPPTSPYTLGETINPSCAVGDTNCTVLAPVPYSGATGALDLGSQNLTTTGTTTLGTVSATSTSGAQVTSKYNSGNYATLTTASNGDITIATISSTTGGNINLNSAVTGDFTLLSTGN